MDNSDESDQDTRDTCKPSGNYTTAVGVPDETRPLETPGGCRPMIIIEFIKS